MKELIGYARISIAGESLEFQQRALDGAEVDRLFVDVASGAKAEHPQRKQAGALLQQGDTLVVWSLDRLDLNVRDLLKLIEDLDRRGVGFRSLKDDIDTTSDTHKPVFHCFAALLQSERVLALERSAPGRAAARASGRKGGRKPKLDEQQRARALTLYHDDDLPVEDICRKLKISQSTFFRLLPPQDKSKASRKPKTKTSDGHSPSPQRKRLRLSQVLPRRSSSPVAEHPVKDSAAQAGTVSTARCSRSFIVCKSLTRD